MEQAGYHFQGQDIQFTRFYKEQPEPLDNGALIARRIIQLPNREADVGAMYVRHLLWRLHETTGDGTAMAAVLFGALLLPT